MGAVIFTDNGRDWIQPESIKWPSCERKNGNVFFNNTALFGSDDIMVTLPWYMNITSNTTSIIQTPNTVITGPLIIQLVDYFGHLFTIPQPLSNQLIGAAVIVPLLWVGNHTSEPSGITAAYLTSSSLLDKTIEHEYSYIWRSLIMPTRSNERFGYQAQTQVPVNLPLSLGRQTDFAREVFTQFRLTMRPCHGGEYVTATSCETCAPVGISLCSSISPSALLPHLPASPLSLCSYCY
jgi:hypothetical protein